MSIFATTRLVAAFAVAATALPIAAIASQPTYETRVTVVSTAGLDLTTSQGAAALTARVHEAAIDMCGAPDYDDARVLNAIRKCRVSAMESTQPQMQAAVNRAQMQASTSPAVRVSTSSR